MATLQSPITSLQDVPTSIRKLCGDVINDMRYSTFCHVLAKDDHLQKYMGNPADFAEVEEGLWGRVFKPTDESTWNSSLPMPNLSLPAVPSHFDLRVHAGALMVDAPPLDTPRGGGPWDLRQLDSPVNEARRRNQPVYLEPRAHPKHEDKIQWFWADRDGNHIDYRLTALHAVNDEHLISRFHCDSIAYRDLKIFYHAVRHNTEMAAYWIRRRLLALVAQDLAPEFTPALSAAGRDHHFISPVPLAGTFRREVLAQSGSGAEAQVQAGNPACSCNAV